MIDPVTAALLSGKSSVAHGFFTRTGGVSAGLYYSLNGGPGSDDTPALVHENRRRVAAHLGTQADHLITLWQEHGDECLPVSGPVAEGAARPKGDALVTDRPGVALGVLSADCAPILFYGEKSDGAPVIGAAHAGWGGALKGVQIAAARRMLELGARLESLCAVIGPCIGQASYEVSEAFADPFLEQDEANERFFMAGKPGHLQFDLAGYNAARLALAGVGEVVITGEDTYSDEARFFSYRRAIHRGEPDYGRQISAIVIKN